MIYLKNILDYLNGNLSEEEKERFLLLLDSSDADKKEFEFIQKVNRSSEDLGDIRIFDEEKEWAKIESLLDNNQVKSKAPRIIRIMAIAASILLFGFAINYFFKQEPLYKEMITKDSLDTIMLIDGSKVYLGKNSRIKYFVRQDKKTNRRYVELEGNATFDIAHNKDLPFVVKVGDAGIDVLGTVFKIDAVPAGIGVENIMGLINLFEWKNASNNLILKQGDKAVFTSDGIRKVLPKPKKVDLLGKYYKVENLLDILFNKYETRMSTAPYADIIMEDTVFIDINQPLESILSQLDSTAVLKYRKTCKNCFEISVLKSK